MNISNTRKIKPYKIYVNKLYSICNNDSAMEVLIRLFFWHATDTSMVLRAQGRGPEAAQRGFGPRGNKLVAATHYPTNHPGVTAHDYRFPDPRQRHSRKKSLGEGGL